MTLADRAVAPKQLAARPVADLMSRSTTVPKTGPATRNTLSSTIGPGAKPPTARTPVAPKRVVSAGMSKSVGPGTRAPATRSNATARPVSRGSEVSRPPSREGAGPKPSAKPKRPAWDTKGRLEDMELAYEELKQRLDGTNTEKESINELLASERARRITSQYPADRSVGIGNKSSKTTGGERSITK